MFEKLSFHKFFKTVVIRFGNSDNVPYVLNGRVLQEVLETKDLGIIIDCKLTSEVHCYEIIRKAQLLNYVFARAFSYCTPQNKFFLFKCYVRPLLDYGLVFYYSASNRLKDVLEKVQSRFTKRICEKRLSYKERLVFRSDTTIEHRHKFFTLTYMYELVFGQQSLCGFSYKTSNLPTRSSVTRILLPCMRTNLRKEFPLFHFVKLWNSLKPAPLNLLSLAAFKKFLSRNSLEA